jgi:hypothetical protein
MDVHFLPNNYCISPVFDVLLNPFQDGRLCVEIVHGNVKEALAKTTIKIRLSCLLNQGCGSGSGLDPDSESRSGSRSAKMTHKSRKFFKVHVLKCWMASF